MQERLKCPDSYLSCRINHIAAKKEKSQFDGWSVVTNFVVPKGNDKERIIADNYFASGWTAKLWVWVIKKSVPSANINAQWLFHLEVGNETIPSFFVRFFGNLKTALLILSLKILRWKL